MFICIYNDLLRFGGLSNPIAAIWFAAPEGMAAICFRICVDNGVNGIEDMFYYTRRSHSKLVEWPIRGIRIDTSTI